MLKAPEHLARTSDIVISIEQVCGSLEAVEQQRLELRLMVMQTKARLAEVKATMRRIQQYL